MILWGSKHQGKKFDHVKASSVIIDCKHSVGSECFPLDAHSHNKNDKSNKPGTVFSDIAGAIVAGFLQRNRTCCGWHVARICKRRTGIT